MATATFDTPLLASVLAALTTHDPDVGYAIQAAFGRLAAAGVPVIGRIEALLPILPEEQRFEANVLADELGRRRS